VGDPYNGPGAAIGKPVTITLTATSGAVMPNPAGPFSGITDSNGKFSANFTSAKPGLITANASTTFTLDSVSLTRDTDPATPAPSCFVGQTPNPPAVKRFVDAKISIAPSAVNEVGHSHTF